MQSGNFTPESLADRIRRLQLEGKHAESIAIIDNNINTMGPGRIAEYQLLRSISCIACSRFRDAARGLIGSITSHIVKNENGIVPECLYHLAEILYFQNNFQEAMELSENARSIYAVSPDNLMHAKFTRQLGETVRVWNYGKPGVLETTALAHVKSALEIFESLGCKEGIAPTLSTMGLVFVNLGCYKGAAYYRDAKCCLEKSLALFREINDLTNAAWQEYNIGGLLAQMGDTSRGTELILKSADHMHDTGNILALAWHYYSLAHINVDMSTRRDSLSTGYYEKALDLFDRVRDEIAGNAVLNRSFFEEVSDAYQRYANSIAENDTGRTASVFGRLFGIAERAKANLLLRQIAWKHVPTDHGLPEYLENFAKSSDAHARVARIIGMFLFNAVGGSGVGKEPVRLSIDEFQKRILRDDEVFVSFYCAVKSVFCLIIQRNGLRLERIDGWNECWESIVKFRECVLDLTRCITAFDKEAKQLTKIFHGVLEAVGRTEKKIIISPDVQISHIPFDSLPVDNRYPLLGSEITYIHSASVLAKLRGNAGVKSHGNFGMYVDVGTNIDMPEAKRICRNQFGGLCGNSSSCDAADCCGNLSIGSTIADIKTFLSKPSACIHIFSHGIDGERKDGPEAAILIGPDKKLLTAEEIASMSIPSGLVVLSTCRSAAGRTVRGEGIDSLCNAFFAAGTQCVIAALWPIFDKDAIKFNELLFRYLIDDTIGKAFSRAKKDVVKSGLINQTFRWAPFVLYGNSEIHLWR